MSAPQEIEPLWTAQKVAELLVCSTDTVYRLAREGKIDHVIVGENLVRFEPEAVRRYINERVRRAVAKKKRGA